MGRESIALDRKCAGPAAAAQLPVLAAPAFAAKRAFTELLEQGRAAPDLAEALRPQIARDLGEIGTRRQLSVGRDAAILWAARTAGFVIENRRIGIGGMHVEHQMRRALDRNHKR